MRQRVVIALALAAEPKLIVADEPTTALDVSIQAQIIQLLKRICKDRGAAVMLITHDMGVIAETCDRVAVMYAGRIAEIGPVHEVINQPAHPYTMGLMAAIPDMDVERERLNQIDGAMPRLNAIPRGCAYNPRCPRAFERCTRRAPGPAECRRDPRRLLAARRPGGSRGMSANASEVSSTGRPKARRRTKCKRAGRSRWCRRATWPRSSTCPSPWLNRVIERRPRQLLHAVDGVSFEIEQGPDAGAGRRVRLRQEHRGAAAGGPVRAHARRPHLRRPGRACRVQDRRRAASCAGASR